MNIRVWSTTLGSCTLTDAQLIDSDGTAHGTADACGYLHHGMTGVGYDVDCRVDYTDAEIEAVEALVLHAYSTPVGAHYGIGASLHALVDAPALRAQAEAVTAQTIPTC